MARRRQALPPPRPREADARGYRSLFLRSVLQADGGCDFDFLRATKFEGSAP
jgi:dihydroxy-acid dehydratase